MCLEFQSVMSPGPQQCSVMQPRGRCLWCPGSPGRPATWRAIIRPSANLYLAMPAPQPLAVIGGCENQQETSSHRFGKPRSHHHRDPARGRVPPCAAPAARCVCHCHGTHELGQLPLILVVMPCIVFAVPPVRCCTTCSWPLGIMLPLAWVSSFTLLLADHKTKATNIKNITNIIDLNMLGVLPSSNKLEREINSSISLFSFVIATSCCLLH